MTEYLQEEIEDYVLGKMKPEDKKIFEEKAINDVSIRKEIADLERVREALLLSNVQKTVSAARKSIENQTVTKSNKGLFYLIGTMAAAASVILLMLSSPILLSENDFTYRGSENQSTTETQTRENAFERARQQIKSKQSTKEAILILENLQNNEKVSRNYQNESKWMLVIAYLQTNQVQKAEKTFSEINCEGIECPFSTWDKMKINWQIFLGKVF